MSRYRIKIERIEETTKEWRDEYMRIAKEQRSYSQWNQPDPDAPFERVLEALSFDADEAQFAAIRRATLEAMK